MKLWPLYSLLMLTGQSGLLGQGAAPLPDSQRLGEAALRDGLWEVAEQHFKTSLYDTSLTPEAKSQVAIHLAEALIRAGNPTEALTLLASAAAAKHPEAAFWKAQALHRQGRFTDAASLFTTLLADPATPHRAEIGFTLASLQLALDKPELALSTLDKLLPKAAPELSAKVQLYQVEILLDLGRTEAARKAMPNDTIVPAAELPLATFLNAQLKLAENQAAEAEAVFQGLVSQPEGQTLARFQSAFLGLADALHAQGKTEAAVQSVLKTLQDAPDSPLLENLFSRLLQWLPDKPSATDPILEGLAKWIPPDALPASIPLGVPASNTNSVLTAFPVSKKQEEASERTAFALYHLALGLRRIGTPEAKAQSQRLFQRLRVERPEHSLAARSLYDSARWLLDAGSIDEAFSLLDTLRETSKSRELRGEAAYLQARSAFVNGDSKKAIALFDEAAQQLAAPAARAAKLQAAIARLRTGDGKGAKLPTQKGSPPDKELQADLELERALSASQASTAKPLLADFLSHFPEHPRAAEARLAAAEAALDLPAPDLAFAKNQLDALSSNSEKPSSPRLALAQLRLADLSKDSAATIALAEAIIAAFPNDPAAAVAALAQGRTLFQTGRYNPARLVLEKFAATDTDPVRAQVAWLLSARAAALGGTPQSKEEALTLFQKASDALSGKGPLASIASLEMANHLIEMARLPEASNFLGKWIKTLPENDPLQLPAGLLLGDALYAQGSGNPASLIQALAVYDRLVSQAKNQPALINRLQYLRGQTLEQLPDEKDPKQKREKQALLAYQSVLETTSAPAEWEFFERCGVRALALLEKAARWEAAIALAQKIASFKGPHAEEAAARASKLKLEHMIWED